MGPEVEQVEHAGTPASVDVWFVWKASFFFGGGANAFTTVHHSPTAEVRHQRRTEPALRVGWCFRVALE